MNPEVINAIGAIANTIILLTIFFYHHSKNKVLENQLTQLSDLIDKQSTIVTSATDYAVKFDVKQIENLIRREVAMETQAELSGSSTDDEPEKTTTPGLEASQSYYSKNYITPLGAIAAHFMAKADEKDRERVFNFLREDHFEATEWLITNILSEAETDPRVQESLTTLKIPKKS